MIPHVMRLVPTFINYEISKRKRPMRDLSQSLIGHSNPDLLHYLLGLKI